MIQQFLDISKDDFQFHKCTLSNDNEIHINPYIYISLKNLLRLPMKRPLVIIVDGFKKGIICCHCKAVKTTSCTLSIT